MPLQGANKTTTILRSLGGATVYFGLLSVCGAQSTEEDFERYAKSPHRYVSSPPGEFGRLIQLGNVHISQDDERLQRAGKIGMTLFRIKFDYRYQFRIQWLGGDEAPTGPPWRANLNVTLIRPIVEFHHTVLLPSGFHPSDPWQSVLVKHEFDHVAISTDPRLKKLIEKTLGRKQRWKETWDTPTKPTNEQIGERIKERIVAQITEFERIVQTNYDALDEASRNGRANLDHRLRFFRDLYSVDALKKCQFLYLDLARTIMQDSRDTDVTEHYLFVDPL